MATQSFGKFERVLRVGEGRRLKRLSEQAAYIGVPKQGPYKPDTYRY